MISGIEHDKVRDGRTKSLRSARLIAYLSWYFFFSRSKLIVLGKEACHNKSETVVIKNCITGQSKALLHSCIP